MIERILTIATVNVLAAAKSSQEKSSVDFFVVGDYGWVRDLTDTNSVFDAIDKVIGQAVPGGFDDADFIATVGDNLYPIVETEPTPEEF